jgi:hypothetical protein
MNSLIISKNSWKKLAKLIIFILTASGIILFNDKLNFERLKEIHTGKEKKVGDVRVNEQLYLYNKLRPFDKLIVTDYSYLWILPEISKSFKYGQIQILKPADPIFSDESVGFLFMSPLFNASTVLPEFIEERIRSGEYTEIFNYGEYRLIKIR